MAFSKNVFRFMSFFILIIISIFFPRDCSQLRHKSINIRKAFFHINVIFSYKNYRAKKINLHFSCYENILFIFVNFLSLILFK